MVMIINIFIYIIDITNIIIDTINYINIIILIYIITSNFFN